MPLLVREARVALAEVVVRAASVGAVFPAGLGSRLNSTQLNQISFYSGSGGATFLGTGGFGPAAGEIAPVPVPESSTFIVCLSLLAVAGWRERRRFLRSPRAEADSLTPRRRSAF